MLKRLMKWIIRTVVIAMLLGAIVFISDRIAHRVSSGSVLVVELKGEVTERARRGVLGIISARDTPLESIRNAITAAGKDPRIDGMIIKVVDPEIEMAQAQEIIALVREFRATKKWTAAYIESAGFPGPGNMPYVIAAATGDVSLMPQGQINLIGVGLREIFARGTLDWLGIHPQFVAAGKYKSAPNMFTEKDYTAPQREEDEALVADMFDQIVAAVSAARGMPSEAVRASIDQAPLNAAAAIRAKLVDRLEYEDEFDERAKNRGGVTHAFIDYQAYARPRTASGFGRSDRIAVIYGTGDIERGDGGFDPFSAPGADAMTATDMMKAFRAAREDNSIRAVVFRVNSPGGSSLASELIRREVELTARKKPVVVSMSGYAASGGYWVSAPAARIVAEPGTITGSIGVFGGKFNLGPAAAKIYLNSGAISRGANVEMFDEFTDFTPQQRAQFESTFIGDTYHYFLKIVAAGRKMSVEDVDQIAQGRVWTGSQAIKLKLVDELGGLNDAIAAAKRIARIPVDQEVPIVSMPQQPSILDAIMSGKLSAALSPPPAASLFARPLEQIIAAAIRGGGAYVAAYCPVVPVL